MGFFTTGKLGGQEEKKHQAASGGGGGFFTTGKMGETAGQKKEKQQQASARVATAVQEALPSVTSGLVRGAEKKKYTPQQSIPTQTQWLQQIDMAARRHPASEDIMTPAQPAEIRAYNKPLTQKLMDLIPKPIREGFFGMGQFTGEKGLLGFWEQPGAAADKGERVMARYDKLVEGGMTAHDALNFAVRDANSRFGTDISMLSEDEKKAINKIRSQEAVDTLFFAADLASFGGASKGKKAVSEVLDNAADVVKGAKTSAAKKSASFADNIADEAIDSNLRTIDPGNPSPVPAPERVTAYKQFKAATENSWEDMRTWLDDDWYRQRKLQRDASVNIPDDAADPLLQKKLYPGRMGGKVEQMYDEIRAIDQDIIQSAKELNVPDKQITDDVNDFLKARHAPERNAALGDGAAGMTNEEAMKTLERIKASATSATVEKIAAQIQDINTRIFDVLKAGGIIDDDFVKMMREKYPNHVPLQRIMDDTEDIGGILTGTGFDVKGTGIKTAKGSSREVKDIMENVAYNYEQAVIRAEKNVVDNATLQFARNNPELGLFEEIKPRAIGKSFSGGVLTERITDPQVLQLYENGKKVYLRIQDAKLATALRGINREKVPSILKFSRALVRWLSSTATRFYPEFAFSNKIRDLQEAMVYMASQQGFKSAGKIPLRDPSSAKAVIDSIRGVDSEGAKLYRQMVEDGGTTGGLGLSTRAQVDLNISKIRKLNRSAPRRAAAKIVEAVDSWNTIFEDSTRLSVYKQALDDGLSRQRAAQLAKDASIDFNQAGTAGPLINSLYMFSNASIQGSVKMARAMKDPKVAAAVVSTVGASVWAVGEWNDSIDPEWYEKVPAWDRMNGLTVVIPPGEDGQFNYFTIPVSWGIKPIKVAADYAYDIAYGKGSDWTDAAGGVLAALLEGYNPVGGTDITSALTPTVLDIPVELARNQGWFGSKIRPDWDKYAPASIQYFDSLKDTVSGRSFIMASKGLSGIGIEVSPANIDYAYRQYIGGTGRSINRVVDTVTAISSGEAPAVKDVPFVNRFYRSIPAEEQGAGTNEVGDLQSMLSQQSVERFTLKQNAEDAYNQFKNLPKEEAARRFDALSERDPELAKKVVEIAEAERLGLTYTDRMINELGVANGERAKYLYTKFNSLETKEEKAALWQDLTNKKIISKNVAEQLSYLMQHPEVLNKDTQ